MEQKNKNTKGVKSVEKQVMPQNIEVSKQDIFKSKLDEIMRMRNGKK